jgi:hypothetical protein
LYGNDTAKDSEIRESASVANALEFIESDELVKAIDESATVLKDALIEHQEKVKSRIGEGEFKKKLKIIE